MYLLDTNILIYYTKNDQIVVKTLEHWITTEEVVATSTIVEAELLSYLAISAKEIALIDVALSPLLLFAVDSQVARYAAAIRRQHGLQLADAMIAATALLHAAVLVTRNVTDFKKIIGLELVKI